MVVSACHLSTEGMATGGSLGLAGQPVEQSQRAPDSVKVNAQQLRKPRHRCLASTHSHMRVHPQTHIST